MVFSIESGRWTLDVGDMERACLHRIVRHELYTRVDRTQGHTGSTRWLGCNADDAVVVPPAL
jgi:hypothetical protein